MPKMKTNRGAAKLWRVTGSGRVKCKHAYKSHILTKKATKRKRFLTHKTLVAPCDAKRVHEMILA